jgi:hypothetical protein
MGRVLRLTEGKNLKIVALAVAAAAALAAAEPANAVAVHGCVAGSTLFGPDNVSGADLAPSLTCQLFAGNAQSPSDDTQERISALDPFGIADWILADRSDNAPGDTFGDGAIDLTVTSAADSKSGTWAVESWNRYAAVFLTLRAGNSFAAYRIDPANRSGGWTTANLFSPIAPNNQLRRISVYYSPSSLIPIPLPATAWLLIGGFGALAAFRRRAG